MPHFLSPGDHPWLRALLEEFERFTGRPERDLDEHLRAPLRAPFHPGTDGPLDDGRDAAYLGSVPARKLRLAVHVLRRLWDRSRTTTLPPRQARAALFAAAAGTSSARAAVVAAAAADLGVSPGALEAALLADIPGERRLAAPPEPLAPEAVARHANLLLAQGLLFRATGVTIQLAGQARALVQHAKRHGLICTVTRAGGADDARLDLSGPFALFRRTLVYGRALGALLPLLAWCRRFRLDAECVLGGQRLQLVLGPGDFLAPAAEPRRYDSRLEERFAAEFRRLAPDWEAIREPEPVAAGSTLIYPDFVLQHRRDRARRWLLEVAGYWTPAYVHRKLEALRAAGRQDLILCLDEERNCAADELPAGAPVLRFRRRVDAAAVLALVERSPPPPQPPPAAALPPAAAPAAPGPPPPRVYRLTGA